MLPDDKLKKFCYEPNYTIVNFVKSLKVPVICFPRGIKKNYINFCSFVKPDCISIDYEVDPKWINERINNVVIQGGMDPKILLKKEEEIEKEVKLYLDIFKNKPYIFNLGHGVLPETKPETIKLVTNLIRDYK